MSQVFLQLRVKVKLVNLFFIAYLGLLLSAFYCTQVLWKPQEALPDSQCEF